MGEYTREGQNVEIPRGEDGQNRRLLDRRIREEVLGFKNFSEMSPILDVNETIFKDTLDLVEK